MRTRPIWKIFVIFLTLFGGVVCFTGTATAEGGVITRLVIREKAGVTTKNYPLTFGHVFKEGDVFDAVTVKIGLRSLTTQCDIKTRWTDGSIRHAVISVLLPEVEAGRDLTLDLTPGQMNAVSGAIDKAEILATDIGAIITLTGISGSGYSGSLVANLRDAINDQNQLKYWLKGEVCTEILVKQKLNNSLNAAWEVRFYPGTQFIRISHSIENVEADYRGNVNYAVAINHGNESPSLVYSKPEFQHNINSRWRKVLWLGIEPPHVEIRYDLDYLISTGHIPAYDRSLTIPEKTIIEQYNAWQTADTDIMENGIIYEYFPTTGGRQEIGLLPAWTARYLLSMDNRMREIMLRQAELTGSCPIHYRESNPTKPFFEHIVSIDDRPTVRLTEQYADNYGVSDDNIPAAIGSTNTPWTIDISHQASFSYIPYLITGERFFLDEMYFWAGWNLGMSSYNSDWGRDRSSGLVRSQVRGEAWGIRNIAHAATMAPDGSPEKNYFTTKVQNNLTQWEIDILRYPLRYWDYDFGSAGRVQKLSSDSTDQLSVEYITAPWMNDFMTLVLAHMGDLGFSVKTILDEFSAFTINRFTHAEYNPFNGPAYHFPAKLYDSSYPQTWKQANELFLDQPGSYPNPDSPNSYRFIALAALGQLTNYPKGRMAYEWLKAHVHSQETLALDPTWAIKARGPAPTNLRKTQ